MIDRLQPHDIDSEEALLGSLLIDGQSIRKIINGIRSTDFYSERNRWVYEACYALYERVEAVNQITVAQELSRLEKLEKCGGASFLSLLISNCPTSLDIEYYAQIINRLSVSRKLIEMSECMANIGYKSLPSVSDIISSSSEVFDKFRQDNITVGDEIVTPMKAANDIFTLYEKMREPSDVPSWGFYDLDEITAGIYPEYIIWGGRPSQGKSQTALDIIENLNGQDKITLLASAEMQDIQIYERKLSRILGLSILDIRKHGFNDEHEPLILNLVGEISESKFNFVAGKLYLDNIYRHVYNLMSKGGLDAVFIDYLGALQDCYSENRDSQSVKIGRASNRIQSMVHEFKIPFIVLAQLNRDIEKRADPKPMLSDLRDSGSLEQDADVIFFQHRDKLEDGTLSNIAEITMAKNRQIGAKPPFKLLYDNKSRRYVNFTEG